MDCWCRLHLQLVDTLPQLVVKVVSKSAQPVEADGVVEEMAQGPWARVVAEATEEAVGGGRVQVIMAAAVQVKAALAVAEMV